MRWVRVGCLTLNLTKDLRSDCTLPMRELGVGLGLGLGLGLGTLPMKESVSLFPLLRLDSSWSSEIEG